MALPALALGWLLVASAPAVKYKASAGIESIVRTPLLTETAPTQVVTDVVLTPRLDADLYTNRLLVKFVYEPKFQFRQVSSNPTVEVLQAVYTRADYKLARHLTLLGVHTTTYGSFPFEELPNRVPSIRQLDGDKYIYTETAAGLATSLGIKRLTIAGTLGWIVNGLLDPPVRLPKRGDAASPQQRGPELRLQAFYGATQRDQLSLTLYGKDVSFSTGNRDALLQLSSGLQHQLSPLVQLGIEPGLAVGRVYPRRRTEPPEDRLFPTLEAFLKAPLPIGHHWPVRGRLRARYLPHMDSMSTRIIPRGALDLELKWEGRRGAKVTGELTYTRPLTVGLHQNDAQFQAKSELWWPLPLSRSLFLQGKGQLTWLKHEIVADTPVVQWFTSVGLVVLYDRGRL